MKNINIWIHTAAGKVSIVMIIISMLLLILAWSTVGITFISMHDANTANNVLIGIATNLLGIVVTVSFVQYFIDKQDDVRKRKDEIMTIKRYDKYMQTLIRRFLMYYVSVTTRIHDRNKVESDNAFKRRFKFSDIADMYSPSMYLNEGFLEPSIVLFYRAEEQIREYMLKMLENIDFKYNEPLEKILQDFVTKSVDLDMRGNLLGALDTRMGKREKLSEYVSKEISNENEDWLGMFQRGKLKGNLMMPYVIFYYSIQDQTRMLKDYIGYIKELDC